MSDLLESVPCGIIAFDVDTGGILSANRFFLGALGYSADEARALKFDDILTMSARVFHQTHLFPLLRLHGRADEIFLTLRHKEGTAVPMLTNAVLEEMDKGARVVCAFLPLQERRKYEDEILAAKRKAEEALNNNEALKRSREELEERLQQLDRNLEELDRRNKELLRFGEIFSHDLREPIRKIRTFSDLLTEECESELNAGGKLAVSRINASCERAGDLLRTLQEYIRIDSDPEMPSKVDLNEVVNAARARIATPLDLENEGLPSITGRAGQLTLLFEYLFRSAVARASAAAPRIHIRFFQIQNNSFRTISGKYHYIDFARIVVSDDGDPFPLETGDSLFELLRKRTAKSPHPDLGICRKIVENHQGSLSLEKSDRDSTAFRILLPLGAIGS